MRYTGHTGFMVDSGEMLLEEAKFNAISLPDPSSQRYGWSDFGSDQDVKIKELIRMAGAAYQSDGLVKQAVDKYAEMFKSFDFEGDERAVKYLKKRLNTMSLMMNQDWRLLFLSIIHQVIMKGNAMIVKYRGYGRKSGERALYENRPYCLSGFKLVAADLFDPHLNKERSFDGWLLNSYGNGSEYMKLVAPEGLKQNGALIHLLEPETDNVMYPGADVAQISYMKGPNSYWGMGLILAGLEDVSLLRTIEMTIAIMLKKFSSPLLHHKIVQAPTLGGNQNPIREAYSMWANQSPDSVIVTGANHEIVSVGAESQALRAEGYLDYFANRAAMGIGLNPILVGLTKGGVGDSDLAQQDLLRKVKAVQTIIAWQIETYIINEILWEGDFDPYNNEDEQVKLVFEDVDVEGTQKTEAHAADMFTKNAITFDQAQDRMKHKRPVDESRLHANMIEKPLREHDSDKKIAEIKAKPVPKKTKESVSTDVLSLIEKSSINVESFVYKMNKKFGYDAEILESIKSNLQLLVDDREAFVELVTQAVVE